MIKKARRDKAVVPSCDAMDDETFWKHMNKRHLADMGLRTEFHYSPLYSEGLVKAERAFHRRLHEIQRPGQYDHEHTEE